MKILLFSRRSICEAVLAGERNGKLRKLILSRHPAVKDLLRADSEHKRTLREVIEALEKARHFYLLVYDFSGVEIEKFDLVICVGGDGTVLYASHHLADTPLMGVNSSPSNSVGYLTSADRRSFRRKLELLSEGKLGKLRLHRLFVKVNSRLVHNRVLNDVLFTSACPALTARYFLKVRGIEEEQMSSGIWIGPAAGSTAAILSAGGRVLPPRSRRIQFVVRELIRRKGKRFRLARGLVGPHEQIRILNKWQRAEIFIDGPHKRAFVEPGEEVEVGSSDKPLVLLGWRE